MSSSITNKVSFNIAQDDINRVVECMEAPSGVVSIHSKYRFSFFTDERCFAVTLTHRLVAVFWVSLGLVFGDIENDISCSHRSIAFPDWTPLDLANDVQYIHRRGSGVTLAFPNFRVM